MPLETTLLRRLIVQLSDNNAWGKAMKMGMCPTGPASRFLSPTMVLDPNVVLGREVKVVPLPDCF